MKYDVLVWGAGRIGYAAVYDLVNEGYKLIVADVSREALEKISNDFDIDTVKVGFDYDWLTQYKNKVSIVSSSLPGPIAFESVYNCLKRGLNMVDATSLSGEDPRKLESATEEGGTFLVAYAGVAPGMIQVLSGAVYRELGGLDSLEIYCGGMPQDPEGKPLKTNITWSPIGYLGMYARKSRKVVNGEIVYVDPLEDSGEIEFPGEGVYEYFLSDGLRSLLFNFKDVPYMAEYSLRWKGHLEQVKLIRDLGLLSKEPVQVGDVTVKPIEVLASILNTKLSRDPRDKVLTIVIGRKGGKTIKYINVTYYDESRGLTAMQQTTGFNLSRFTAMALNGYLIREKGINYPEEYGLDEKLFKIYLDNMKKVGITFKKIVE